MVICLCLPSHAVFAPTSEWPVAHHVLFPFLCCRCFRRGCCSAALPLLVLNFLIRSFACCFLLLLVRVEWCPCFPVGVVLVVILILSFPSVLVPGSYRTERSMAHLPCLGKGPFCLGPDSRGTHRVSTYEPFSFSRAVLSPLLLCST